MASINVLGTQRLEYQAAFFEACAEIAERCGIENPLVDFEFLNGASFGFEQACNRDRALALFAQLILDTLRSGELPDPEEDQPAASAKATKRA